MHITGRIDETGERAIEVNYDLHVVVRAFGGNVYSRQRMTLEGGHVIRWAFPKVKTKRRIGCAFAKWCVERRSKKQANKNGAQGFDVVSRSLRSDEVRRSAWNCHEVVGVQLPNRIEKKGKKLSDLIRFRLEESNKIPLSWLFQAWNQGPLKIFIWKAIFRELHPGEE